MMVVMLLPSVSAFGQGVSDDELPGTILLYGSNGVARLDENGVTIVIPPSGPGVTGQQPGAVDGQLPASSQSPGALLPGVTVITPETVGEQAARQQAEQAPVPMQQEATTGQEATVQQEVPVVEEEVSPDDQADLNEEQQEAARVCTCTCPPCPNAT